MTRLKIKVLLDYHFSEPTEILLAVEAASMTDQLISEDSLIVRGCGPLTTLAGGSNVGKRTWTTVAEGNWRADYRAIVEVDRAVTDLVDLPATPLASLPADVIPFLWPSRYCEADRLCSFADAEFGQLSGGKLVLAIVDWVRSHLRFVSGWSDGSTTAVDTFVSRQGVCRDYAHLTAALVRAKNIPARLASVYAWRLDPPDFHAVVEVWLDHAWHIVDASGLAPIEHMVRIAAGRDATDIAFLTAFGAAALNEQSVSVALADE